MGSSLILNTNHLRSVLVRASTPTLYNPIKRYKKHGDGVEERAPSLADEFKRVAEEKAKAEEKEHFAEEQGVASQTADKTNGGAEEATIGHADVHSVKKRFEEHEPGADYRRG